MLSPSLILLRFRDSKSTDEHLSTVHDFRIRDRFSLLSSWRGAYWMHLTGAMATSAPLARD
jgi:hypothetical protein